MLWWCRRFFTDVRCGQCRGYISKLQAFEMMCFRRVQGLTRMVRVRNQEVREVLGQEAVTEIVKEKQRKWK